jgi:hypothetical protein
VDLILSKVALAASADEAPAKVAVRAKVIEEINASLLIFMWILLETKN